MNIKTAQAAISLHRKQMAYALIHKVKEDMLVTGSPICPQVLSEASRISGEHLLTIEPGISENQTDEMKAKHLQLVVPSAVQRTYKPAQQPWLMNV